MDPPATGDALPSGNRVGEGMGDGVGHTGTMTPTKPDSVVVLSLTNLSVIAAAVVTAIGAATAVHLLREQSRKKAAAAVFSSTAPDFAAKQQAAEDGRVAFPATSVTTMNSLHATGAVRT